VKLEILDRAENDLVEGFWFYEWQRAGLGAYFLESLYSDIESLKLFAGIHRKAYRDYYRMLSKRFPFAVFYKCDGKKISVYAVVDCRKRPSWIRAHLTKPNPLENGGTG
jgi:hypothetical protein